MPFVEVITNVPIENKAAFAREFSEVCAKGLSKELSHFMVEVRYSEGMAFNGSSDPCAMVKIMALGGNFQPMAAPGTEAIAKLGVPPERVFINFVSLAPTEWAKDGKTIAEIYA